SQLLSDLVRSPADVSEAAHPRRVRPPFDVGDVLTAHGCQRDGQGEGARVASADFACRPRTVEGGARINDAVEGRGQVELVGVRRGQSRCGSRATAAPDDRRVRPPYRLRHGPALLEGVVAAGEAEALPDRCRPDPRQDRQLLMQTLEPLLEWWERDPVGAVLLLVPPRAEPEQHPSTP